MHVFAPGQRNPYDLVLHTNGHIYATDNGPSSSTTSLTCTQEGGGVNESDKLTLIEHGNYYGFPNRNRGRTDPRECTYHLPTDASSADFTPPIAILPPNCSCDGIAEYTSDAFGGAMRGDLIIAQWRIGSLARVQLSGDGSSVMSLSTLSSGFQNPLDVTVGPAGIIYIADYGANDIAYLQPRTATATAPPIGTAATVTPATSGTPTATSLATLPPPTTNTPSPTPSGTPTATPQATVAPSTYTPSPTSTPTPHGEVGDANCDGSVNAIDAALVLQYGAGLIAALPCPQTADVNHDGSVNAIDAALILQYVAGLVTHL